MPPAARITDGHVCPASSGPVTSSASRTIIGFQRAARVGDRLACSGVDTIVSGASNVMIEHQWAARIGDATAKGGVIAAGCPTVLIGTSPQAIPLAASAPFAEECPRKRAEREARERREAERRRAEREGGDPL